MYSGSPDRTEPKSEADAYRGVDTVHCGVVKVADALLQAALVYGSDLFEQYDRIAGKPAVRFGGGDTYVGGHSALVKAAGYRRGNDGGAVAVAGVVLDYQHGAQSPLLRTDHRAEVGVIYISASDIQTDIIPFFLISL